MSDKLTPQQAAAVHNRGGNLLVSAAAGSGKTKVLVDRLLTYLMDEKDPANLDEFLIITYTKAAASELRGKIAAKLTEKIVQYPENRHLQKQMQRLFLTKISTVHGFCGDLLREYAYCLDVAADFRVADENECREIRENVLSALLDRYYDHIQENADFRVFVDTQGLGRDDRLVPEIIEQVYNSARCHLSPDNWLENCMNATDVEGISDASETIWGAYLIKDLHEFLDCQIHAMTQCAQKLENSDRLEKPAVNFRDTVFQLQNLRSMQSWDEIARNKKIDFGRLTYPTKNVDKELCERTRAVRNACKKNLERKTERFADYSEQILKDLSQVRQSVCGLITLVKQFEQDYSQVKKNRRILDFSDLEHKTLDLLLGRRRSGPTAVAREIGQRFREILVDEYQDSNAVQDKIFWALSEEKNNCFLVGDVKQSIYQFRLADPGIFLEKYRSYVPAAEARAMQGRKIMLSHNFRSGPEIIEAVNAVFGMCMSPEVGGLYYGEAESLREGIPHEKLPDPGVELYALSTNGDVYSREAEFVAEKICQMLAADVPVRKDGILKPVQPEDIVILLRSPGSAGKYFQKALEKRGIPCATGSGTDLLKTEEIGTLRALLQTIVNPRQDIPLISVLASPLFGFTAEDLAQIRSRCKYGCFYDALLKSESGKAQGFVQTLNKLRGIARMNPLTVLLEACFSFTRMDSIYNAMSGGDARRSNLQTFYQLATDFEKGSLRNLPQFLNHLEALDARGLMMERKGNAGCVTIMSIHKSKGLEFPVVFLSNLSRKFNMENVRAQVLCDKELGLGLSVADNRNRIRYPSIAKHAIATKMMAQSISEEMRVLYVAMTRARDRLIMTYAAKGLEEDLKAPALRCDFDRGRLYCREALCMGEWVLAAAVSRTEAGQLHALGGKPVQTFISDHPWKICFSEQGQEAVSEAAPVSLIQPLPENIEKMLLDGLSFRYAYTAATKTPSKQTVTDRKGRQKDMEAAEDTQESLLQSHTWRQPSFRLRKEQGKNYGNAIHAALQHIQYENCGSVSMIQQEIVRLVEEHYLTEEQGNLVNCEKIAKFFATDIGKKLRSGTEYLREFKFSILDRGEIYGQGLEGEEVLLQGVVDCALLEKDGITVLDFKTDFVTEESLTAKINHYRSQVLAYADALCRIYEMPVKMRYLYFFHLDRLVEI